MTSESDILSALQGLPEGHPLRDAPAGYKSGFAAAAARVYPTSDLESILQQKFGFGRSKPMDEDTFLQSACELTVQNHAALSGEAGNVEIEKQMNPPKDVDAYFEVNHTKVSIEVKCAVEPPPPEAQVILRIAGRVPNHEESFAQLSERMSAARVTLGKAKNKDNTLKDFLLSANSKFSPNSDNDHLNILFVGCEDYFNIQHWYFYLFENEGLFTRESFHPTGEFALVDLVILSNLKYCHTLLRDTHDWSLDQVFILPIINPFSRKGVVSGTILDGLSIFDHHLHSFNSYTPSPDDPGAPQQLAKRVKVSSYVVDGMGSGKREFYFPTMEFEAPSIASLKEEDEQASGGNG